MKLTCKKHNVEFEVLDGCPQCVAERMGRIEFFETGDEKLKSSENDVMWVDDVKIVGGVIEDTGSPDQVPIVTTTLVQEEPTLLDQIKIVAEARQRVKGATECRTSAYQSWLETNQYLFDLEKNTRETCTEAETLLRELTIKAYNETGSKNPCPGVGIRVVEKLEYDPRDAFTYAKEHGVALKLDTASFEKMAKIPELRPGFVTVSTEAQATIAQDLDTILKEAKQ